MDKPKLKDDFEKNGFVIIDSEIEEQIFDRAIADLDKYFGTNREVPMHVPYSDHNRIQDAWHISQDVFNIALAKKVLEVIERLYDKTPRPFQTLNFYKGTGQRVHSDTIHFNSEPFGAMCGAWIALEDISDSQGPLVYYPGSQKLPEMNYEDFSLEPSSDSYPQYLKQVEMLISKHAYQAEYGILKKGQCLIWSANILHGGSFQTDKRLTRKSQVTHYYLGQVKSWRPDQSKDGRFYFDPEIVQDMSAEPFKFPLQLPKVSPVERIINAIKKRIPPSDM